MKNNKKLDITDNSEDTKSNRKEFLLKGLTGVGFVLSLVATKKLSANEKSKSAKNKKYGMVIDLQSCTGCGACDIACKNENNVPQGFWWHNHITVTEGTFPNVKYTHYPTLCNHCENAPCVKACPTRAMYKENDNITMHDAGLCIGCTTCAQACPYDAIAYNDKDPHQRFKSSDELIEGCTGSGKEIVSKTKSDILPYYNKERNETLPGIRPKGIVEKCTFCDHRVKNNELPYCVMSCPADAIIFGDMNDPDSEVSQLIRKNITKRIKVNLGTRPSVYYINDYNPTDRIRSKGSI